MKTALNKPHLCKLEGCENIPDSPNKDYCSDAHRKYAWKKRHWKKYLAWQRKYMKNKKQSTPATL